MKTFKRGNQLTPVFVEDLRMSVAIIQKQAFNRICSDKVAADDHDDKQGQKRVRGLVDQYYQTYYLIRNASRLLDALNEVVDHFDRENECEECDPKEPETLCGGCQMVERLRKLVEDAAVTRTQREI